MSPSSCYPKHLHNLEYSHLCSKAPSEVRTVELYGSWDNFANGYFLQHDLHKGCGNWTGVPHFPRIICDGDRLNWSKPRSGALKQGGRYWYYVGCLEVSTQVIMLTQLCSSSWMMRLKSAILLNPPHQLALFCRANFSTLWMFPWSLLNLPRGSLVHQPAWLRSRRHR